MQTKPQRILVVDDEESFADVVAMALTANGGFQAIACHSGREAIDLLKTQPFDVILLDYKMPDVNGLNVLQWMHEQKMETPVVMLTGAGSEDIAVEAMKLGAYDYARKEHVDIGHLPHLLAGVYERYLFRKDRERAEQERQESEKRAAAIGMARAAVAVITTYMKNALAFLEIQILNQEYALKQFVPAESAERVEKAFADLHTEFRIIATGITALTGFSEVVSSKPVVENEISRLQEDIQKTLATLKRLDSAVFSDK